MNKLFRISTLAALLASPTLPMAIESAAIAQVQPAAPPPVAPLPAVVWTRDAAEALLTYVEGVGAEGLDPDTYAPERLRSAIASRDDAQLGGAATDTFMRLATDLSGGAVRGNARVDWHMTHSALNAGAQRELMARAVSTREIAGALNDLLPVHPQYRGLKRALAQTPESDAATRALIRTNLERWRWMPRGLGARHVIVNVPAFTAALVEDGRVIVRHRTVVGAVRTPTPQLNATIRAVTFNPWWHVPQSIIREMGGRFGSDYQVTRNGNQISARQQPGPRNSLGRVKIEMPNDHAIYLHDTPAQALFSRTARAFSHGCIRTQNVRDFAAQLLAPTGEWRRPRIDQAIAAGRTVSANLAAPIPVYIAYFTAAATDEGEIVRYNDVYGRDAPVKRALGAS
ncbi:MAG TPA: L,D-transpeptidase family protein [Allosphingosinicella sp.]|nr:L,D-transpeptidase family protein [Allosphingosinicella sp.]